MRVEIYGCREGKTIDLFFCCIKQKKTWSDDRVEFVLLFKSVFSDDKWMGLAITLQRQEIHTLFFYPFKGRLLHVIKSRLLLRNHQPSQQTNFGRVLDQPGLPAPKASFIWDMWMYVCMYLTALPRFQVIENKALWIRKNFSHQSGIDVEEKILFRVESHRFRVRRVWKKVKIVQIPMTKADLFLRIFESIPGTLKRFETLTNVETLCKPLRNVHRNVLKNDSNTI